MVNPAHITLGQTGCLCVALFCSVVQKLIHFVNLTRSCVGGITSSTLTWVSSWRRQVTFLFVAPCKEVLNLIVKTGQ